MDIEYLLYLQNLREATGGIFNEMFLNFTTYAEALFVMMGLAVTYWCIDNSMGTFVMLSYSFNRLANGFIKITACVYRPWIRDARIQPLEEAIPKATGYSFPSGHTTNAMSVFGAPALWRNMRWYLRVALFLMVACIGFSRNYVGVHTPQDVGVAIVQCTVVILICRWLTGQLEKHPNWDLPIAAAGIVLSALLIAYAALKQYPVDYDAAGKVLVDPKKMAGDSYKNAGYCIGFFVGWLAERRFIHFSTDGSMQTRWSRAIFGCLGLMLFMYPITGLIKGVLPTEAANVVSRAVQMLYIVLIAPALFKLFERQGSRQDTPQAEGPFVEPDESGAGRHFKAA